MAALLLSMVSPLAALAANAPARSGNTMTLVPEDEAAISSASAGDEVITLADARMDDPVPGSSNNNNANDPNGNSFANS